MRLIVTGMLSLVLANCGPKASPRASQRERETLSPENYEALKQLNALLVDNDDAMSESANVSGRAQKLAQALKGANCRYTRHEARRSDFKDDWSASQVFEGNGCPVHGQRDWRYNNRNRELVIFHSFDANDAEYRKLSGVNKVDGSGSIQVLTDPKTGVQKINGEIKYTKFEVEGVGALETLVRTSQSYQGAKGNGTVAVTIARKGEFSYTGGIRWSARDFAKRTYFVGKNVVEEKSLRELFSYFELDKIVDDSERMR